MDGGWETVEVKHEQVIDRNPQTWINSACEKQNNGDYSGALKDLQQAREFSVGDEDLIFLCDLDEIIVHYKAGTKSKARKVQARYANNMRMFREYFLYDMNMLISFLKTDETAWQRSLHDVAKELLVNRHSFEKVTTLLPFLDAAWLAKQVTVACMKDIILQDEIKLFLVLRQGGYPLATYRTPEGANVTMLAAHSSNYAKYILEDALQQGLNSLDDEDHMGWSALDYAIDSSSNKAVDMLLAHHANVSHYNHERITPLMHAYHAEDFSIDGCFSEKDLDFIFKYTGVIGDLTKTLVDAGASVNAADDSGKTVLMHAVDSREGSLVRYIIEHGANVHATSDGTHDALYYAALMVNNVDVVTALLDKGADPNKQYENQKTILHIVAKGNHWSNPYDAIWRAFVNRANVNIQDSAGYTPLMYSVDHNWTFSDELDMARALVRAGADTNLCNHSGDTVRDIMRRHNIDPDKLYNNSSSNFFTKLFS